MLLHKRKHAVVKAVWHNNVSHLVYRLLQLLTKQLEHFFCRYRYTDAISDCLWENSLFACFSYDRAVLCICYLTKRNLDIINAKLV